MNFRVARSAIAFCLLTLGFLTLARQAYAAGDVAAGKTKAEICAACHGDLGIPEMPNVPALAGQTDNYLQWQLVYFRSGRRKNELMSPIAQDLTDKDVRNLGAYFASLPKQSAPTKDLAEASLIEAGKKATADHRCAACHTDTFGGAAAAPDITHQHHDYLIKALTDYRENARPSSGVGAMNDAANGLTDDDIKAIAAYLETYK
jgi:cytochrome c553